MSLHGIPSAWAGLLWVQKWGISVYHTHALACMVLCVLTCWCMSSQKSVCRHAHVFMPVHPCIWNNLFCWYVFGYRSMFFSLFCLSMHLLVSGYTRPWLCVCASCCTSVWPMCLHAWAQLDFICDLPRVFVRIQPTVYSAEVLQWSWGKLDPGIILLLWTGLKWEWHAPETFPVWLRKILKHCVPVNHTVLTWHCCKSNSSAKSYAVHSPW